MARRPQQGILNVSFRELAELLRLPADHQIERISLTETPYAPGLLVSVSGPAMHFTISGGPLCIEAYSTFIAGAEKRAEQAEQYFRDHSEEA